VSITWKFLRHEIDGPVATITINHPPANALSHEVLAEIGDVLQAVEAEEAVRCVIFTGAGRRFFSAGADITEFPDTSEDQADTNLVKAHAITLQIERMGKVVIMAINGLALGGGLELAMAADIRLVADTALLGQPEIRLGLMPGFGGSQRFPRLVGRSRAMELLFSGESIDAQTAFGLGLVTRVVTESELMPAARQLALKLAQSPRLAVAAIKRAVYEGAHLSIEDGLQVERRQFAALRQTADAQEGISAFLQKRQPQFPATGS
jgi:enoyl-CoA hydratase